MRENTVIRPAQMSDVRELLRVYSFAQDYMISSGNPTQWGKEYPNEQLIRNDIDCGWCYVVESSNRIIGAFCAISGKDATYDVIEEGAWIDDTLPYTTLHRIASDASHKGIFDHIIRWCDQQWNNLRIDTHQDNHTMRHLIEKHGFQRCGIIFTRNQSARIAYQRIK